MVLNGLNNPTGGSLQKKKKKDCYKISKEGNLIRGCSKYKGHGEGNCVGPWTEQKRHNLLIIRNTLGQDVNLPTHQHQKLNGSWDNS